MFSTTISSARGRRYSAWFASFAFHGLVLFLLVHHFAPAFVTPSDVDLGTRGSSGSLSIVYLAPVGIEQTTSSPEKPKLALRAKVVAKPNPPKAIPEIRQPDNSSTSDASLQTARGGSPYGQHVPGAPLSGDEVVPALPEVFPDPAVSRSDLPAGVEGDVIVEVTIDAQGNVIETRLLHSLGYGIEQKVLAVLRLWHFRPAMRDGVTIASQHVVYFHYPS